MDRITMPAVSLLTLLIALPGAVIHSPPAAAGSPVFQFPHLDQQRPTPPPDSLSFGSLLEPTPAGLEALHEIPSDLLLGALTPDDPLTGLLQAGQLSQAVELTQMRLAELEGQDRPAAVARARVDLGMALYLEGQHGPAAMQLERGLAVARPGEGWFDERWIGAFAALGLSQQALGRHEQADRSLVRAQHLIQRRYGATDNRQLPLLLARAHSQDALQDDFSAGQLHRTHLKLIRKDSSALSSRRVAAVHLLADWLVEHGRFKDAVSIFNSLLAEQRAAAAAEMSPEAAQARVAAMTGLSQVYLLAGGLEVDRGLTLAREAASIVEQHSPAFEPAQAAAAHLFAGDWLTLFGRRRQAAEQYQLAWQRAGDSPEAQALQAGLRQPALIFEGPDIPLSMLGQQWANDHVFANFELKVRADGRPAVVHLTGSNLHATNIRTAQQLLRLARFRPALEDGRPVASETIRHHRVYNTEPYEGFGQVQVGGTALAPRQRASRMTRQP